MPSKNKTENKTVAEKPAKALSAKRQAEQDHLQGKHKVQSQPESIAAATFNSDCGFCQRRPARIEKKAVKTVAYLKTNKSK